MVVPVLLRHGARPRPATTQYRRDFAKLIWQLASPKWDFDDATFERSAASFDNPDHVAIVIHNYRWRLGLAEGEPQYDDLEQAAGRRPGHHRADHHPRRRCQRRAAPGRRAPTRRSSRAGTSTGSSRAASATTCRRKPRRPSPRPSSTWMGIEGRVGRDTPMPDSSRSEPAYRLPGRFGSRKVRDYDSEPSIREIRLITFRVGRLSASSLVQVRPSPSLRPASGCPEAQCKELLRS